MCGISGYYSRNSPAELSVVRKMNDVIAHRGPDDEGFHVDGGCAIGMRRLAIIDLNTGHQPVSNEDGTIWVVFNGEIYNYRGLRDELIAKGHRFRTSSDTEVLVHLYEQEGTAGIARLHGMFAYAIWDSRDQSLLLVRDRFGKKPLYYAVQPDGLHFGSEIKCLRVAGVPLEIDEEALQLYFFLSYIPEPYSAYRAVRKLEPGSWMKYYGDGRVQTGVYWTMPVPSSVCPAGLNEEQAAIQVREKFDEAVKLRLVSDVPVGAFLSGGLDSGSVVASMALQSQDPVKTFSIGFAEADFNELAAARLVAEKYKTEHHEILVKPDSVSLIHRLADHFDEPFADSSAIPTWVVSEFAAEHVKVVLSGDGGDEFFAGYPTVPDVQHLARFDAIPQMARRAMSWFADRLPYSAYGKNYLRMISRPNAIERYFERHYGQHYLLASLLAPKWQLPVARAVQDGALRRFIPQTADFPAVAQFFEASANLTGDILVKVDRMSMANSLEVRAPLLDHSLAELAFSLPLEWKMRDGKGKQILRKALDFRLPQELLTLPKKGFAVPLNHWFRGELREFLNDHLLSRRCAERGMLNPGFVRAMLDEHQSGRRDNGPWLWRMLMLEVWCRRREDGV